MQQLNQERGQNEFELEMELRDSDRDRAKHSIDYKSPGKSKVIHSIPKWTEEDQNRFNAWQRGEL